MSRHLGMTQRAAVLIAAGAAFCFTAAACGGSTTNSTPSATQAPSATTAPSTTTASSGTQPAAAMTAKVKIVNFTFDPMAVTIAVGGTVTWLQVDSVGHSVQSNDNAWVTSAVLMPGQTFAHTFTKPGTYSYICGVHTYMKGTVTVVK